MKRGEIRNVIGGPGEGRPRPVVIIQDESFDGTHTVTVCAFTAEATDAPLFRLLFEPTPRNGLTSASRLMVDKVTTIRKSEIGSRVGRLDETDLLRFNRAMLVFLGLARSPRASRV